MGRIISRARSSGMALVIVLGFIVLTTLIVLGFTLDVGSDLQTSKGFENQASARMLADSAVNFVISQVRDASTLPDRSWASQPGLIHTFDASGAPSQVFKLYSSDRMVVNGRDFDPAAGDDLPPTDWRTKDDLYADLNSPLILDGKTRFPIVDGNGIVSLNLNGGQSLTYDTDQDGKPDVEGFAIDPAQVSYDPGAPLSAENQPVPMPVKWLYLLKDGQLVPASESGAGVKVGGSSGTPTAQNPIVARLAFWTDDETSKVNLNTASEGTYWDTPIAVSQPTTPTRTSQFDPDNVYESDLAWRQGVQGEYQRYPGHPATTALSPILGPAIMKKLGLDDLKGANRAKFVKAIADIAPRVGDANSSKGGTVRVATEPAEDTGSVVTLDSDRLYASTDELRFTPKREAQEEVSDDAEMGAVIERSRFFLTTNSRAPEENLFNKPRVAIWPITLGRTTGVPVLTAFDRLIAFCSTVGKTDKDKGKPFYFTRQNPTSPTVDWSARNQQLYTYLQQLTGRAVPGYGGTFSAKFSADRDQVLTEIFDYIRCTNLRDNGRGATSYTLGTVGTARGQVVPIEPGSGPGAGTRGFGRIATISEMALVLVKVDAQKTASDIQNATQKQNAVINPYTQTRLECVLLPELFSPMAGYSVLADDFKIVLKKSTLKVGGQDPFNPVTSQPAMYAQGRLSNPNSSSSKIGGVIGVGSLIEAQDTGGESAPADSVPPNGIVTVAGVTGGLVTIGGEVEFEVVAPSRVPNKVIQHYRFVFPTAQVPIPDGVINSGQAKNNIKDIDPQVDGKIENITNNEPLRDFLFAEHYTNPRNWEPGKYSHAPVLIGAKEKGTRMTYGNDKSTFRIIIASQDTVRSVVASAPGVNGDMRIVAGQTSNTTLDEKFFAPSKGYDSGGRWGNRWAHSLSRSYYQSSRQTSLAGADFGSLLADYKADAYTAIADSGKKYSQILCPDIPAGIDGAENADGQSGDWDNGPGYLPDGPYLNKADEGVAPWTISGQNVTPYLGVSLFEGIGLQSPTYFSPNRQIPSAAMFGSLPTGVKRLRPWQTLLFRPARSYLPGGVKHPGSATTGPPDHLLLDLFWMPVVEPYAISEPFSTAGKVNLNYQIAPFTYIRRDTALRAALKPVMITALNPDQQSGSDAGTQKFIRNYKAFGILGDPATDEQDKKSVGSYGGQGIVTRRPVQLDATLNLIDETRFQQGGKGVFRSASEICDVPLVPRDVTGDPGNAGITARDDATAIEQKLAQFWSHHRLTGDNSLERPYAHLYPRVTTKSNTYTVYVRVQTLLKNKFAPSDTFNARKDLVTGEFRGSFVIERYLDQSTTFDEADPNATLGPYKFGVVRSKQFSP